MDTVVKSKNDDGFIVHTLKDRTWTYNAVRMGIAWPTPQVQAYLCVFGNLYSRNNVFQIRKMGPIRMIHEARIDTMSLDDIWAKVMDCAKMFWCEDVYADLTPKNIGYRDSFRQFTRHLDYVRPFPVLSPAPYADNFLFGYQLAEDWRNSNKVSGDPDSILASEMDAIRYPDDFVDKPEDKWNAINAYRYVLASFQRNLGVQENMVPKRRVPLYLVET